MARAAETRRRTRIQVEKESRILAAALEAFDRTLPAFLDALRPGDLAVLTADHGCDPTWRGSDHTREQVPVLFAGPDVAAGDLGQLAFADVGATLAAHLGLAPGSHGVDRLGAAA
mgnify:CR=1 FL=1